MVPHEVPVEKLVKAAIIKVNTGSRRGLRMSSVRWNM